MLYKNLKKKLECFGVDCFKKKCENKVEIFCVACQTHVALLAGEI